MSKSNHARKLVAVLALWAPLMAGQSDCEGENEIEIAGSWTDNYNSDHDITDITWMSSGLTWSSVYHVQSFSNAENYVIAQNDPNNDYNPSLWSRFDWTDIDSSGGWYYCQIAYSANSYEDALNTNTADKDNMDSGCGGFSWSYMSN